MQNQAETAQASPSIALTQTIEEIRGLGIEEAIEKLRGAARLGLNILSMLKERRVPQSANIFPAPAKKSIAQVVHGLSVIPGGRDYFERKYKLLRNEVDTWMKEVGLIVDGDAPANTGNGAETKPEQVPATTARKISVQTATTSEIPIPLLNETAVNVSTTLPATPFISTIELGTANTTTNAESNLEQCIETLVKQAYAEKRLNKDDLEPRKNNPNPPVAFLILPTGRAKVAQFVHTLRDIPGGREAFMHMYRLPIQIVRVWLIDEKLPHQDLMETTPDPIARVTDARGIDNHAPVAGTEPADTVPQHGKNNGAPQNGNGHVPKTPAPKPVQDLPAKQTRLDKLLDTPPGATSLSPAQAIKDILSNETPIETPHADILKEVGMIIDGDPKMMKMWKRVCKYAANPNINMLIRGESGCGKELVPNAIHKFGFADKKFVIINCGAFNPQLIESAFFGHERGAFTGADKQHIGAFEEAAGGVIALDEIGDLDMHLQVKLLRAIENKKIRRVGGNCDISIGNIKIIATTNRKIPTMVEMGTFRHDLYLRIAGADIYLPPLRDRTMEHKTGLVTHFLKIIAEAKKIKLTADEHAMHAMASVKYIGNVREMKALIEKVYEEAKARNATAPHITLMDVLEAGESSPSAANFEESSHSDEATHGRKKFFHNGVLSTYKDLNDPDQTHITVDLSLIQGDPLDKRRGRLGDMVATFEKIAVFDALRRFEGNQSKAAIYLGITRGKVRQIIANEAPHDVGPTMEEYLGEMKFTLD